MEKWRDIQGYEGFYQVSNFGRVKSISRTVNKRASWGGWTTNFCKGKILHPGPINSKGHIGIHLWMKGKRKPLLVHRLVLETFIGPCPYGMEACHFPDRDPGNNKVENLRWDTRKGNHGDRFEHGTNNAGATNGTAILTDQMVLKMRKIRKETGISYREIGEMFDKKAATVRRAVCAGWKHLD